MSHHKDKVGSSPEQAGHRVGKKDFGAHEDDVRERNYVSEETKRNDPGKSIAHSGTGTRTEGVGGNESGRGASSGGDIDTGANSLAGIGDKNLHPRHDKQTAAPPSKRPVLNPPVVDDTPTRGGALDNESSTSAADVNNETAEEGNAFKGDVTSDEATGGA